MWCLPEKSEPIKRRMIFDEEEEEYVFFSYAGPHQATEKEIEIYEKSCEKHGVTTLRERYYAEQAEELKMIARYGVDYHEWLYD